MTSHSSAEKAALDELLESGILDRSQNLQKLLLYICQKHFEGHGDQVKEYSIATEALGRPADFDQKKDSIVRVEIHRLRKRLSQYYAQEGKDKTVEIVIPEGKYVPHFIVRKASPPVIAQPVVLEPIANNGPVVADARIFTPKPAYWRKFIWVAGAGLIVFASIALVAALRDRPTTSSAPPVEVVELAAAGSHAEIRILAGRTTEFVDSRGQKWSADSFFQGGVPNTTVHPTVEGIAYPELFAVSREGDFQYDIPLDPTSYELRLYFAEMVFGEGNPAGGAESSRLFHVVANGVPLLEFFDVLADAPGPRVADVRVFKDIHPAEDGKLHLAFRSAKGDAFVNAIELRRSAPGRIRPVRMVAQSRAVRDAFGRSWEPDDYVRGGSMVRRTRPVENTESPELYRGERYGVFAYSIPVAMNGIYRVSLHFNEAWFGPVNNGQGGAGSRLFNVHLNHQPVLYDFDLFKAAGGSLRAFVKTVHGVKPNPRGRLVVELEATRNYACLNAIEVEDQSPALASAR